MIMKCRAFIKVLKLKCSHNNYIALDIHIYRKTASGFLSGVVTQRAGFCSGW